MRVPQAPPDFLQLMKRIVEHPSRFERVLKHGLTPLVGDRYRHWATLRRLHSPAGMNLEEWWFGIKIARQSILRPLPLKDLSGAPFFFSVPDPAQEMLRRIDRDTSGQVLLSEHVVGEEARDRYIVSQLMDEAISSSQLEGAATTLRVAREMIRAGRSPRNRDERMVLNNYRAMEFLRSVEGPLTVHLILDLHRQVTEGTLDPSDAGRLRDSDEVLVRDEDNNVMHRPPPAAHLAPRMEALCRFANAQESERYVHPVVRAILLHFWLAYDHPFVDGNGRTARALFYWAMRAQEYWLSEVLSISRVLRRAPSRYARAFLYVETDGNDVTYFVLFHLEALLRAIDDLKAHLKRKRSELRQTERLLRTSTLLNHRQLALLSHAMRHESARYTIRSHQTSHRVVYQTARSDLLELARRGLLIPRKVGRTFEFSRASDLQGRLRGLEA